MSGTNDALRLADGNDECAKAWLEGSDAHKFRKDTANELRRLHGERATLADWIAEALSVLETDAEGDDAKRLLIEQGNALVVAVRGGER